MRENNREHKWNWDFCAGGPHRVHYWRGCDAYYCMCKIRMEQNWISYFLAKKKKGYHTN